MIPDVVADKLDVRAAAAGLAEAFDPAAIYDLAEDNNLEESVDDAENEGVAA